MEFIGEHLQIGKLGHFLVLLAFVSSLIATISYAIASWEKDEIEKKSWIRFARVSFLLQTAVVLSIFFCIFFICSNHYIEYLYAYKHTSKELEFKYLLACIWEDQSGSFLLWSIWHCALGIFFIYRKPNSGIWESPVMTIISLAQVFLSMMIMGVFIAGIKIGNSPFVLTRNEINGPIFGMPNYLSMIKDGIGLNVLLRNYWMVIHPPVLFLGFASTIIPFAFAYAGLQTKRFSEWIKPAIPFTLFSIIVLGTGIMMGGKWAYESLSFGGYWAWDPVENASLVPWIILVAALHTMLIYNATKHSLKASYLFTLLGFIFVLYSTFLTRTGILGDTSVHAFTEAGKAMNILILIFLLAFTIPSLLWLTISLKKIPNENTTEESTNSREFWMFIGSLLLFLAALFIIAKTSIPVVNAIFNTKLAPAEDIEFSYNKVIILIVFIIGILSAITQYFKYKNTSGKEFLKKISFPTLIAALITLALAIFYPITYYKQGTGFLIAVYATLFAAIYSLVGNADYIRTGLKGNLKNAGGSIAHLGFAIMLIGILISSGNKKIISVEKFKTFALPTSIDPITRQQDNPTDNINLIKDVPNTMGDYTVTYFGDSTGNETGRRYYHLLFERKDADAKKITESFVLSPDVYIMKDNNMSSNPDTKHYLTHDVFTYISFAMNPEKNIDTAQFRIKEMAVGDTMFYSKGMMVLNGVSKNPISNKFKIVPIGPSALAELSIITKDSMTYHATPMVMVDSNSIQQIDDTVYAQNIFVRFAGVSTDKTKIKIGLKESNKIIDFVTLKSYIFPYINLVWFGLIIMAIGAKISILKRTEPSKLLSAVILIAVSCALFYMFLLAN